jgi:hypothetical protein
MYGATDEPLKGQFHEKFGEMGVWALAKTKSCYRFLNFSDRLFNSCDFSKLTFCLLKLDLI